jgi:hypothetical protein
LPGKGDGHLFPLIGGAPDRHFRITLEHGVSAEQSVWNDDCPNLRGGKNQCG